MDRLVSIFELEDLGDDRFLGPASGGSTWSLYGGHLLGQSVISLSRTIDTPRPIHSLHGYFISAGDGEAPVTYQVDRVRDGGSFSLRQVTASQAGRTIFSATASFQESIGGLEHADPIPDAADPETLPSLMDAFGSIFGEALDWDGLDVRWAGHWPPDAESHEPHDPHNQLWIRSKRPLPEDPVLHAALFAYASDLTFLTPTLLPHGRLMWSRGMRVTSLDHSIWFHRPFVMNDWLLYDQVSPAAAGGRGLSLGSLYTATGLRVASTAQEGLIRQSAQAPAPS